MVKYHGSTIHPDAAAIEAWRDGHAFISFADTRQVALAFEYAGEVAIDNGAYSFWGKGKKVDVAAYVDFIQTWSKHPAFAWCVIPDVIDGTEAENDELIRSWPLRAAISVPVWHLHETTAKLKRLVRSWPRVAIGSSGEYADIGTEGWKKRMAEAMAVACDAEGYPRTKLHGLRQMDNDVTSNIPYSSVDSVNIGRNVGMDSKWIGPYMPASQAVRAAIMRDRIRHHAVCRRWTGEWGRNLELFG